MRPPRLLIVSHETTLTGAPMNLLHLVRWITGHTDAEVQVLALRDGPLRYQFQMVAPTAVLDRTAWGRRLATARAGLRRLGSSRAWKPVARAEVGLLRPGLEPPDLVYLNSLGSLWVLPFLPPSAHVVVHVHELHVALRTTPAVEQELLRTRPDRWIAASGAVVRMLVDELGIPEDRISLHHEFIDTAAVTSRPVGLREQERLRRSYRIPTDAAIVMGAGTVDWRKGPDLFVQLACEVRRRTRDPVHFVWVGGDLTGVDMARLHADMERAGADHVLFVGEQPDPLPWFSCADVFALTSREDPFPLVCLEHAALGHPVVTFRNGGIVELLEAAGPAAAAGVVDHLDTGAMAERIVHLLASDTDRARAGTELCAEVHRHHDVGRGAPAIWRTVRQVLGADDGDDPSVA